MKYKDVQVGQYYYFDESRCPNNAYSSTGICLIEEKEPGSSSKYKGFRADCLFHDFDGDEDPMTYYFLLPSDVARLATEAEIKEYLLMKHVQ